MLNRIIRFSIANKLIIGILVLALVGLGIYDLQRLPIDAVPDITNNQVQIITVSPSQAAPEVERLITFPIEQSVASVPGIKEMRSFSRFGLSLVTVVFDDATDVYWARQQVTEKLNQVKDQIPADAGKPELAPVTTGLGEIFQYAVRPKKGYEGKYSAMDLRTIQDWIVRRQLLGTPGVADVSSFGGFLKQYEVAVSPDKLKSMGVNIKDVFNALQGNNQNTGGAYIEKGPNILYIRTEGLAKSMADIGSIFVKHTTNGIPVFVRDVAEVKLGTAVRYGAMCFNDQGEVAGAVVMMLKGANSSKVIKDVKDRITQIEKTLPEGVTIEPFLDRTKMVNNAIGTVKQNLLEGALIVIFVLVLFLGNIRAGLIVASVIPLAMLFAIIMMNLFGVSGNLMSLGALDFGLIVDGAVIIVEAVMHRLYHSKQFSDITRVSQETMNAEVEHSSGKMMNAAVFGQIIILIVYLPILTLVGIEGKMFKPMAQTVSFALIGAFILSLTYIPMISSLVLNKKINHKATWADKMMTALEKWYTPLLKFVLKNPKTFIGSAAVLLAVSIWVMTTLGGEFIPKLEEGDFAVDTRVLTGSSLTNTIEVTQKTAHILLTRFPEVKKVVTKIGSGEIPTDPMPVDASDMMVILKDKHEWTSAKTFDELATKMSTALEEVPGVTVGFQFPVQMRFNELMTGARQDVVCKIFGEDLDSLSKYAGALGEMIKKVDGTADLYVEAVTGLPQIVVDYNREAMSRFQLSITDVNQIVKAAFAGESAGMIYENERRFNLVVRVKSNERKSLDDIRQLLIPTPTGLQIPLSEVADIQIKDGPNQIQREEAKRRIVVGFNVRGRDVASIVSELQKKVDANLKMSPGYYVTYGGQFENLVQAKARLSIALPVALLLIFIMLYFAFGNFKYGLLIFSAIPLSAIGGIFALVFRSMPFSISAGIGFIALFGVAVLNGIVLISEFNRMKKQGIQDLNYIVLEGTKLRLRPVLMTAAVASLGFLPMALSNGAGAEVQRPLATVVIGGLITATILTLLLLPLLYTLIEKKHFHMKADKTIATILVLFLTLPSFAQEQKLSLDSVVARIERENIQLKSIQQQAAYWNELSKHVFETAPTQLGLEYGNINSAFSDTRFFVNQTFQVPAVYNRQKRLYESQFNLSKADEALALHVIKKEASLVFYQLVDLEERMKLIVQLDSLYSNILKASSLRYKTGETNLLEKANAEVALQQLRLQASQLQTDFKKAQLQLKYLMHANYVVQPEYSKAVYSTAVSIEWSGSHPLIARQEQQIALLKSQQKAESSLLLPQFSLGYSNLSIKGWQSPDGINQKYYSASNRFNIASVGVGLPLFTKATRTKIAATNRLIEGAVYQRQLLDSARSTQYQQVFQQYVQSNSEIQYYESSGLKQADLLLKTAQIAFQQGEIGYAEWALHMQQALQIKVGYINALSLNNQQKIELNYLNGMK